MSQRSLHDSAFMAAHKIEALKGAITSLVGDVHIIMAQSDPDAIGSALILEYIINAIKSDACGKVFIYYGGEIGHRQDMKLCCTFNLYRRFRRISQLDIKNAANIVLVDSSSLRDRRITQDHVLDPVIILDHHPDGVGSFNGDDGKCWIIDDVAACSTMLLEALRDLKLELPKDDQSIALCAMVGIYTDSQKMRNATLRDWQAATWALSHTEKKAFAEITKFDVPMSFIKHLGKAIKTLEVSSAKAVAYIGEIDPKQRDDIAIISSILARGEDYNIIFIWGLMGDMIRYSVRTKDSSYNLKRFMEKDLKSFNGCGFKIMPDESLEGGGSTPIQPFFDLADKKLLIKTVSSWFKQKLFKSNTL